MNTFLHMYVCVYVIAFGVPNRLHLLPLHHARLQEDEDQGVTSGTTEAGFQFTPVTSAVPVGGFNFWAEPDKHTTKGNSTNWTQVHLFCWLIAMCLIFNCHWLVIKCDLLSSIFFAKCVFTYMRTYMCIVHSYLRTGTCSIGLTAEVALVLRMDCRLLAG